jgi:hypothetical protein
MRKEVSPAVFWVLIGTAAIFIVVIGFRMLSPGPATMDKTGSDQTMKQFQTTGEFYKPPANAPVPGGTSPSPSGAAGYLAPPGTPGR